MAMTHLGSGIWSYTSRRTGAIFCDTRPATIIRSACRGEARKTSEPKRAMSKREALAAIISMAQQARPKVTGQSDDSRAQSSSRLSRYPGAPDLVAPPSGLLTATPVGSLLGRAGRLGGEPPRQQQQTSRQQRREREVDRQRGRHDPV